MSFVILDIEKQEDRLVPAEIAEAEGIEDSEGRRVIEVGDDFSWETHEVDWATLTLVENLGTARATKKAEIAARVAASFLAGFWPQGGPLEGESLQVRDETDRTNWLASAVSYGAAVAAGQGEIEGAAFRTASNATITTTFAIGHQILLAMQAWGGAIMACSWRLKDQVELAETRAAIAAIDVDSETWPSGTEWTGDVPQGQE